VRRKVNFPRDTLAIERRIPREDGEDGEDGGGERGHARNPAREASPPARDVRPVTRTKKMNDRVTERAMSLRTARDFFRAAPAAETKRERVRVANKIISPFLSLPLNGEARRDAEP